MNGKHSYTDWWFQPYPSEKYESQLGWLFPIYGKIKNVPNHQPVYLHRFEHTFGAYTKSLQPLQRSRYPYINPLQMVPGVCSQQLKPSCHHNLWTCQTIHWAVISMPQITRIRSISVNWDHCMDQIYVPCRDRTLTNSAQTRPQHL